MITLDGGDLLWLWLIVGITAFVCGFMFTCSVIVAGWILQPKFQTKTVTESSKSGEQFIKTDTTSPTL